MPTNDFQTKAKDIVRDYYNAKAEKTDGYIMAADDVYVVWFAKTLQNWKVLISTKVHDGMYYEITHDGDKCITYLDAYKKFDNVSIPD